MVGLIHGVAIPALSLLGVCVFYVRSGEVKTPLFENLDDLLIDQPTPGFGNDPNRGL